MERLTPLFRVSLMCFAICKAEHFHLFIYVFTPIRLGLKACSSPETHPLDFAFAVQEKKGNTAGISVELSAIIY